MSDDPRLQQILEEILELESSPEEVCRDCPELLHEVCKRLAQVRNLEAQFQVLFPESSSTPNQIVTPGTIDLPEIPGYEMQAVLGHGGMGVVYKALHVKLNRSVAIKMLITGAYSTPVERERFLREAEAVAGLQHPHIVQVYDVGDLEGRPYFTMEFVPGGSLARKLAATPQPAREAAILLLTLANAIQRAHEGGVIHRDLKPANSCSRSMALPRSVILAWPESWNEKRD